MSIAKPLQISLSVRVSDGSFETQLSFPIDATQDQRDWIVKSWLQAMEMAVKGTQIDELLPEQERRK